VSTIYLSSALHDLNSGELITTELIETEAQAAVQNLKDAGLVTRVEMRTGDARSTLTDLDRPIDMLFLDGSNNLYLEILTTLEPQLHTRSVVAADLSHRGPYHLSYYDYVKRPENGFLSVDIPIDAGLVISTRK
jgi:predicted O-methyltransferase YrrM